METTKANPTIAELVGQHDIEWPVPSEIAMSIARIEGYRLDRAFLQKTVFAKNRIVKPGKQKNQYRWSRGDVVRLLNFLERRRRWDLTSPVHRHKFNQSEIMRADQQERRETKLVDGWLRMSVVELVASLPSIPDERHQRILAGIVITRLGESENA